MFCRSCGIEILSDTVKYCPQCGAPLEGVSPGRKAEVELAVKTSRLIMKLISALWLFGAAITAFMPFFQLKGAVLVGILSSFDIDVSLVEAELMIDLFVILTICLMSALIIFLEKESSGIRQIVAGVLLIAAGLIVYNCDKGKVADSFNAMMQMGGSIAPSYGLYYYMWFAGLLIASGVAMMAFNYFYKNQKKK